MRSYWRFYPKASTLVVTEGNKPGPPMIVLILTQHSTGRKDKVPRKNHLVGSLQLLQGISEKRVSFLPPEWCIPQTTRKASEGIGKVEVEVIEGEEGRPCGFTFSASVLLLLSEHTAMRAIERLATRRRVSCSSHSAIIMRRRDRGVNSVFVVSKGKDGKVPLCDLRIQISARLGKL